MREALLMLSTTLADSKSALGELSSECNGRLAIRRTCITAPFLCASSAAATLAGPARAAHPSPRSQRDARAAARPAHRPAPPERGRDRPWARGTAHRDTRTANYRDLLLETCPGHGGPFQTFIRKIIDHQFTVVHKSNPTVQSELANSDAKCESFATR